MISHNLTYEELELIRLALGKYQKLAQTNPSVIPFNSELIKTVRDKVELMRGPTREQLRAQEWARRSALVSPNIS